MAGAKYLGRSAFPRTRQRLFDKMTSSLSMLDRTTMLRWNAIKERKNAVVTACHVFCTGDGAAKSLLNQPSSFSRVCDDDRIMISPSRLLSSLRASAWFSLLFFYSTINSVAVVDAYRHGDAVGILIKTHTPSSGSKTLEAYRHQLPRFGVSTVAHFNIMNLLDADEEFIAHSGSEGKHHQQQQKQEQRQHLIQKEHKLQREQLRFSISFDGGFHHIPWMDIYNPYDGDVRALSTLVVTIVYSSSDGTIHGVHHREAKYRTIGDGDFGDNREDNEMPKSFNVEYIWVNEADVDVRGSLLVLFGTVLIASLYGMMGAFKASALDDDDEGGGGSMGKMTKRYKGKGSSLSLLNGGGADFGSPRDVGFEKNL